VKHFQKRIRKGITLRRCVLVVENPGTWRALVQAKAKTGERLMRKTNPPEALVQNEGDEPGVKIHAELTAGSETGGRLGDQAIGMDLEVANNAVRGEAGTKLGSSDPPKIVEKSDRGALIELTNLDATSQFRKISGRAGRKSSRQLLGTDVQLDGFAARGMQFLRSRAINFIKRSAFLNFCPNFLFVVKQHYSSTKHILQNTAVY
jgi:hypothetical protein